MAKTFIDVLEQLEKTTGTNEKIEILQTNKDVPHLKEYLDYATNPQITFGVATLGQVLGRGAPIGQTVDQEWDMFKALVDKLASRELTGNNAINNIHGFFATIDIYKWYKKCILKDLASIGLGLRLLEKGFGETKKFRLMLAAPEDELDKVEDGKGYLDKKANGVRTVIEIEDGKIVAIYGGRNGLVAENFYFVKDEIEQLVAHTWPHDMSYVLDGEVHVNDVLEDTMSLYGFKYRTEAEFMGKNGKVKAKAYETYLADEERINKFKAAAKFTIFDVIGLEDWKNQNCTTQLHDRKRHLAVLNDNIKYLGLKKVEIIESKPVNNIAEGVVEAQSWIKRGFEGGIFKKADGLYEWKRSRNWVKIKEAVDFEIQFTGYEIQKDKYNSDGSLKPPMVGKVKGKDADGNEYKVGTGKALDEKTRQDMLENWETKYKDKIGTCSAQRPSGKGKYICPRLDIIRWDRNSLD